ncbi:hypothetical protein DYB37_011018 [Aphanomyces astaci]|uniref:Uncharacterized protein n=1 Tax=Aphanomyces astaci TaxID=112090 RepID=A0A418FAS2_APHAT|nr:hypothetical protein DYB37_011018 [Aphanomyces astaci]
MASERHEDSGPTYGVEVYFDMPPRKTLAEVGKSSKVDKKNKHSERISVVLTVRTDCVKLPLLFIIKGQPGGLLEKNELPTYDSCLCCAGKRLDV